MKKLSVGFFSLEDQVDSLNLPILSIIFFSVLYYVRLLRKDEKT